MLVICVVDAHKKRVLTHLSFEWKMSAQRAKQRDIYKQRKTFSPPRYSILNTQIPLCGKWCVEQSRDRKHDASTLSTWISRVIGWFGCMMHVVFLFHNVNYYCFWLQYSIGNPPPHTHHTLLCVRRPEGIRAVICSVTNLVSYPSVVLYRCNGFNEFDRRLLSQLLVVLIGEEEDTSICSLSWTTNNVTDTNIIHCIIYSHNLTTEQSPKANIANKI